MRWFFKIVILSLFCGGCVNESKLSQYKNSNFNSVSLAQIEEQRKTLHLKPIKTSGYLTYRNDNDQNTKGFFILQERKFGKNTSCSLDSKVPPLLILKSELPKKYQKSYGMKVTVSGIFENRKSDFIILSGSKGNIFAGRNGPLKKVTMLSVEENESCQSY